MNYKEIEIVLIIFLVWLVLFFSFIFSLPLLNSDEYSNSTINIYVNVVEPAAIIEILPNNIYLGNVTKGYNTTFANITFNNKGTLDLKIIPVLSTNANEIFNYLEFGTATCSAWHNLSYYSNLSKTFLEIDKPAEYGGINSKNACMRIDLSDYNKTPSSYGEISTELTIWVMPA